MRGESTRPEHRETVKPPAELEALDYFVGSWSYTAQLEAGADGPARDTKGTLICRWELGKFHLGVAEDDELTLAQPRRRQSRAYWSYDPAAKLYTCAAFYFGGGRFIGSSAGWRRDQLTFSGDLIAGGERVAIEQSFTSRNDDELSIRVDMVLATGGTAKRLEQTCHRERDE
jgi:hypothetical protein